MLETKAPQISAALWRRDDPPALVLHCINHQTRNSEPIRRGDGWITAAA